MAFSNSFLAPWGSQTNAGYMQAIQPTAQVLAKAPSDFANNFGQMYDSYNKGYGSYNQGLASLGNSYAQNYAAMASGIAGLANGLGNTWNNAQSANQAASAAEAARQAAIGNLGTAAMTSYGGVAGQGLQAWAANQNGYQKALSDMSNGNQNAVSQLGVGRYNALAGLGKSGAAMDVGRSVSAALPGLVNGGGGGYGSSAGGGGSGNGYALLNGLRGDINNGSELGSLNNNYAASLNSLNFDQALARNMPRTMVNDAYGALRDFNTLNLNASSRGMNQFYDYARNNLTTRPGQAIPTGSILDALAGGYSDSAGRISSAQRDMRSGWGDASSAYTSSTKNVNDLWNNSIGNTGIFNSPLQSQQMDWQMQDAAAARRNRQQASSVSGEYSQPVTDWQTLGYMSPRTGGWRYI